MIKNLVIVVLLALCSFTSYVALRNSKPICDDLVRYPADYTHELVCELGLGDIPEDKADVIMRPRNENQTRLQSLGTSTTQYEASSEALQTD